MILIDNTVLSNFARIGRLQLLRAFCQNQGGIPLSVMDEFQKGVERNLFPETDISWLHQIEIESLEEQRLFQIFNRNLGIGESACLAIAICRKCDLLTDDRQPRQIAFRAGVRLSGSIGVLLSLIKRSHIKLEEGNQILKEFIHTGYFSPVERLDHLI